MALSVNKWLERKFPIYSLPQPRIMPLTFSDSSVQQFSVWTEPSPWYNTRDLSRLPHYEGQFDGLTELRTNAHVTFQAGYHHLYNLMLSSKQCDLSLNI